MKQTIVAILAMVPMYLNGHILATAVAPLGLNYNTMIARY